MTDVAKSSNGMLRQRCAIRGGRKGARRAGTRDRAHPRSPLSSSVVGTAATFAHRFLVARGVGAAPPHTLALASLLLAAKAEEAHAGAPRLLSAASRAAALHGGLAPPPADAVLDVELALVGVLTGSGGGGLLPFAPYRDALAAAAASPSPSLAPGAWAGVTAALRAGAALWAPPHVIGLAAVALAAADAAAGDGAAGGAPAAPPDPALAAWFATLDVDLDAVAAVAAAAAAAAGRGGRARGGADAALRAHALVAEKKREAGGGG
jgi:hypothetical protein